MMNSEKQNGGNDGKTEDDFSDATKDEGQKLLLNGKDQVEMAVAFSISDLTELSDPTEDELLLNASDISDTESEEEGHKLLLNDKSQVKTLTERLKSFLVQNCRNLAAIMCLWIAYLICNMALSMLASFFPKEVLTELFISDPPGK